MSTWTGQDGPTLTPDVVEELKAQGLNQNQIAALYGVSRQYVSQVKKKNPNYSRTPREVVLQHYPWNTGAKYNGSTVEKRMRDHFEYMATGGKGMSEDRLQRLGKFYWHLKTNNVVVEFDPAIPPSEGNMYGGFAYRPRRESDGDLIIRVNKHTKLTDEGKVLLRFPPSTPV